MPPIRTRTILTALLLTGLTVLLLTMGQRTRAAALDATTTIYLPQISCPTCTGSGQATPPMPTIPPSEAAAEVLRLVNIERAKVGCPAAVGEPHLMAATQDWAAYMKAHTLYQHATAEWYEPYGYNGALENIGGGVDAADIFQAWMNSSGHRANLLWCYAPADPSYNPNYVYVAGVGYADPYWVWGLTRILP